MNLTTDEIKFITEKLPEPFNSIEKYEEYFNSKLGMHSNLCTSMIAEVNKILSPLIKKYSNRFFCRIDDSHSIKTPLSIIDKIRRSEIEAASNKDAALITPDNFLTTIKDLARFRIVCNFLSDIEETAKAIGSSNISKFFNIKVKDTIFSRKRTSGERSKKLILEHKSIPGVFLEIQIITQLQEAWDKKDHYLVYEKKRSSPKNDDELFKNYLDSKMSAMAELLFVADDYFEKLRMEEEEGE
jgi:ppGpp synthetase/RelA/SpoT-type nucleotidyltranferase